MADSESNVGDIPASLRARLELSQVALAEKAMVSRPTLAAIEAGGEGVALSSLRKVAVALCVTPAELLDACERKLSQGAA